MIEQPIRCWIHPKLKQSLKKLYNILNEVSLEKTNYPIPKGLPFASKLAAEILNRILNNKKTLIKVKKLKDETILELDIFKDLKNPILFLVSSDCSKIINKDNNYLNIKLHKIVGIKKNEVFFR